MQPFRADFIDAVPSLHTVAEASTKRLAWLTAALCAIVLVDSAHGDDQDSSSKVSTRAISADRRTDNSDRPASARIDRPASGGLVHSRGALGVMLTTSRDEVSVAEVIPGSPADLAGLRTGDEIHFVGDQRIRTTQALTDTIRGIKPGTQVDLLIRRNGRRQVVEAKLAAHETTFGNGDASRNDDGQKRQRMAELERQIQRLQHEVDASRVIIPRTQGTGVFDVNSWWERQHHGAGRSDPDLFQ
jgi:hypothetical protein